MTKRKHINISHPATGEEEWLALKDSLMKGWLTQGPKVEAFEEAFARRHSVNHAIASTSCTTALHLILTALDIGPGAEIIVPAFTWIATANVVQYCGATPVFVDVDPISFNMDSTQIAKRITENTKAIIPVHLFGLCADIDAIVASAPGIPVIEDAACAAGSFYKGRSAGTLGLAGAFSFHPRKSITTGEGGMVTTNDDSLAERISMLRNHGASVSEEQRHKGPRPYILPDFNILGFNCRMTDLQGAVGLVQLTKLDSFIDERQKWTEYYDRELADLIWLRTPIVPEGYKHSWQSYVCMVDEAKAPRSRNKIMEHLQSKGISTRPGTHAVHMLGYYSKKFGFANDDFPVSRDCAQQSIALPLHNRMVREDYECVVKSIKELNSSK